MRVERVRAQLFALRSGTPRFADILRREWLFQQLWFADSDPRLPEGARVFIAGRQYPARTAVDRLEMALFGTRALDGLAVQMAAFLDAQRLGWPACAASVALERARTGSLPRDAPSACPPIEPQATCGEQGAPMRIVDDGQTPHVAVTLSDGSEFVVPLARTVQGSAAVLR